MEAQESQRDVAHLAGARMPADHGLSALGLIMQLFGSLFLGVMALIAMIPVMSGGMVGAGVVFAICALGAVRSAFHRMAGTSLLYRNRVTQEPMRGVNIYIGVGLAHTVLVLLLVKQQLGELPVSLAITLGAALAAWPLALLAITRTPRLRRLASEIPTSEDLGFEGAAVLMIILGTTGALAMALYLWIIIASGESLATPSRLLLLGTMVMLLFRSIMHVMAGVKGTSGVDSDGATEAAARYYNFGVVSSVIVGAVLLIITIMGPRGALDSRMLLLVGLMVYLLLAWPLILRRFYSERNFAAMMECQGPSYRRAPDAGLTALGWLLFAWGVFSLATSLPAALFEADADVLTMLQEAASMAGDSAAVDGRSPWWSVGLALVQLWAALELIGMTDRHRIAASAYGVIGTVVTIHINWSTIKELRGLTGGIGPMSSVGELVTVALAVVVPVCSLILVNREITPMAQARVRSTPA